MGMFLCLRGPHAVWKREIDGIRKAMDRTDVTILQHERNESGGLFEEYIGERRMNFHPVPLFETNEVPPIHSTHLLIMGGPMSVHDEKEFPWLKTEKQIVREWVTEGRPVLGICLGAQLIASSFGAAVYPCDEERGWSSVIAVRDEIFPELPRQFRVYQMHGETFEIPQEGELIYRDEKVFNQAICIGSALGLQFHPEITLGMIKDWIANRPRREQALILAQSRKYLPESRRICRSIGDRFLSAAPSHFAWISPAA